MAIEILIVDDNSDIRNILNELIKDAGYETRIAANYNQALKEIDKKKRSTAISEIETQCKEMFAEDESLTENQVITKKIAIFDTENDIND